MANSLISRENSGKIRQMDYLLSEQERCITMKSAIVSLLHASTNTLIRDAYTATPAESPKCGSQVKPLPFLINVSDTPGHIDFSNEVLGSLTLCDGALLLVDVVEGPRSQTFSIMTTLIDLGLSMVLVLNKMDKLFTELHLSPFDAFIFITSLVARMNVLYNSILASRAMEQPPGAPADYFDPCRLNVVFASAYNGWAFNLYDFAVIISRQHASVSAHYDLHYDALGNCIPGDIMLLRQLLTDLWSGEASFSAKTGTIAKTQGIKNPVFASLILATISHVYEITADSAVGAPSDKTALTAALKRVAKAFKKATGKTMHALTDLAQARDFFFKEWLPLSTAVFDAAVYALPDSSTSRNKCSVRIRLCFSSDFFQHSFVGVCSKALNKYDYDIERVDSKEEDSINYIIVRAIVGSVHPGDRLFVLDSNRNISHKCEVLGFLNPFGRSLLLYPPETPVFPGSIVCLRVRGYIPHFSILFASDLLEKIEAYATVTKSLSRTQETPALCDHEGKDSSASAINNASVGLTSLSCVSTHPTKLLSKDRIPSKSRLIRSLLIKSYILLPMPLIAVIIRPKRIGDYEHILSALRRLVLIDTGARYEVDRTTGDVTLYVTGSVHLDRCCEELDGQGTEYVVTDSNIKLIEVLVPGLSAADTPESLYADPPGLLEYVDSASAKLSTSIYSSEDAQPVERLDTQDTNGVYDTDLIPEGLSDNCGNPTALALHRPSGSLGGSLHPDLDSPSPNELPDIRKSMDSSKYPERTDDFEHSEHVSSPHPSDCDGTDLAEYGAGRDPRTTHPVVAELTVAIDRYITQIQTTSMLRDAENALYSKVLTIDPLVRSLRTSPDILQYYMAVCGRTGLGGLPRFTPPPSDVSSTIQKEAPPLLDTVSSSESLFGYPLGLELCYLKAVPSDKQIFVQATHYNITTASSASVADYNAYLEELQTAPDVTDRELHDTEDRTEPAITLSPILQSALSLSKDAGSRVAVPYESARRCNYLVLSHNGIDSDIFSTFQSIFSRAYRACVQHGPVVGEPVHNQLTIVFIQQACSRRFPLQELPDQNLTAFLPSQVRFPAPSPLPLTLLAASLSFVYQDFIDLIRKSASMANIRIGEKHLRAALTITPQVDDSSSSGLPATQTVPVLGTKTTNRKAVTEVTVANCFARLRAVKRAVNYGIDGSITLDVLVPQLNSIVFPSELRTDCSGNIDLTFRPYGHLILPEDPRHINIALTTDEEIEWGKQGRNKTTDASAVKGNTRMAAGYALSREGKFLARRLQLANEIHYHGANTARKLCDAVRNAKGLTVMKNTSIVAEKQRTLKKNR